MSKKKRTGSSESYLLSEDSAFLTKEDYKTLRTNITFSLPGSGAKCIGVTSSTRGEGKSTTIINVAISFGQIGKKVLLVDGDLRLPTVARKTELPSSPGFSDVLAGQCSFDEAVQHQETLGIDVLTASILPPDPTNLMESQQMEDFINEARQRYDYIFIDLPPIGVVTDALILSRFMDGFLFVVRHNQSSGRSISEALKQIRFSNAKVLGFVYTNDELSSSRNYYYYSEKGSPSKRFFSRLFSRK